MAKRMRRAAGWLAGVAVLLLGTAGTAQAVPFGIVPGPDSSFSIGMVFTHDPGAVSDIVSMVIDGTSTAVTGGVLLWDDVFFVSDPPGATSVVAGVDTSVLTFTFADTPDGFGPGETFDFSLDPDVPGDPGFGVRVSDLIGTLVTFTFRDSSTYVGVFVDDPEPGEGLVLNPHSGSQPVPEPSTLLLLGAGLFALAARRRRAGRV